MKPHISLHLLVPITIMLCLLPAVQGAAAPRPTPHTVVMASNLTLLNPVGQLSRTVSNAEIGRWKRQLQGRHLSRQQAALLHLWLGEVEIARNKEPERALDQFRQAQRLARRPDPIYGCAAYDRAITLFLHGAYAQAVPAFHDLIAPQVPLHGYSRIPCALWYRHAAACAGYHAQHAKLGITEPPSLDPLCGVASLAACLQANARSYDRKTLLFHCRMTGLGNNMQDLLDCAQRLGMSAWPVKADAQGLIALPKPLVAYVELDHFVAVTRADSTGVSYLCSDCGAWPGGRRDLTWKQWRAMDCNLYLAVTKPASPEDNALRLLVGPKTTRRGVSANNLAGRLRLAATNSIPEITTHAWMTRLSGIHIVLWDGPPNTQCGQQPQGSGCHSHNNTPTDPSCPCEGDPDAGGPGPAAGGPDPGAGSPGANPGLPDPGGNPDGGANSDGGDGGGPLQGDPVNLATGEEEYSPMADLTVYNPIGPNVVWRRHYGSLRGPVSVPNGLFPYAQYAFGNGWTTDYDIVAISVGGAVNLTFPNGAIYTFNIPSTPTPANPQVVCSASNSGTPMLCTYNYNTDASLSFVFTNRNRTQWVCSSGNGYALSRIVDRNGNFINLVYTTPAASAGYALAAITDSSNRPLLTVRRNAHFNIVSISDRYSRSILYEVKRYANIGVSSPYAVFSDELILVSQIFRTGTISPPARYTYGYQYNTNGQTGELLPALHTITVPSPTGRGVGTATINYNGFYVASHTDANGNTTTYTAIDDNDTQVTISDSKGNVAYSYTVGFDAQMRTTYRTDGTNTAQVYQAGYLPDNAYQPASTTDANNETTTYTYDSFGQVTSITSPRNVTTTYTFDYSVFPLGELKQVQEGSKSPISYSYYEPSGLPKTITIPAPGTSSGVETVTTSFSYDGLGNLLTIQAPGNDTTPTITTTLNYTQDGVFTQPAAIGQPLTITDNLGHLTHLRYDAQGNRVAKIDAIGNETDAAFNLANQQTRTFAPAIGDLTHLLRVTRSTLKYNAATKTYNGTLTLTNSGTQSLQGCLLIALTNLAPGVTLANASGIYVNSPTRLTPTVSLAPGAKTIVNVGFTAPSANAVSYGVQTYLTDSQGNPVVLSSETRNVYLYPGGPLLSVNVYDETGALYRQVRYDRGKEAELLSISGSTEPVRYVYDGDYRVAALGDGNGHLIRYSYNTAGWLESVTYPMGDTVLYPAYDPMGNVLERIDGRGIETDYVYNDPESRLTNIEYVNSANYPTVSQYNISVGYDGYGRMQAVQEVSGVRLIDYDDLNDRVEIDTTYSGVGGSALPTVLLSYAYNPDGSRHGMNLQTPTTSDDFSYGYDAAGRAVSVTNPFNETTRRTYLANNWVAARQVANGMTCQYAYDRRGFVNDQTDYGPTGTLVSDFGAMVYDAVGNPLTRSTTSAGAPAANTGQTAYAYDARDQLTQEISTLAGGYHEGFQYDAVGNALSFKGKPHGYNADNQSTDAGFSFDGSGNPTSYVGAALTFDPENHATAFGSALTAAYRADGLRAWKSGANGTTYFIYDGLNPVMEMDGSGTVIAVNTFGPDGLISRHTASGSVTYAFDPQGSVSRRLDASGNLLSSTVLDGYGSSTSTASAADPFGFGAQWGYYADTETGLCLLGLRYYDPAEGRFLTRDPIGADGGADLYEYVANRPTFAIDPSGEISEQDRAAACARMMQLGEALVRDRKLLAQYEALANSLANSGRPNGKKDAESIYNKANDLLGEIGRIRDMQDIAADDCYAPGPPLVCQNGARQKHGA